MFQDFLEFIDKLMQYLIGWRWPNISRRERNKRQQTSGSFFDSPTYRPQRKPRFSFTLFGGFRNPLARKPMKRRPAQTDYENFDSGSLDFASSSYDWENPTPSRRKKSRSYTGLKVFMLVAFLGAIFITVAWFFVNNTPMPTSTQTTTVTPTQTATFTPSSPQPTVDLTSYYATRTAEFLPTLTWFAHQDETRTAMPTRTPLPPQCVSFVKVDNQYWIYSADGAGVDIEQIEGRWIPIQFWGIRQVPQHAITRDGEASVVDGWFLINGNRITDCWARGG